MTGAPGVKTLQMEAWTGPVAGQTEEHAAALNAAVQVIQAGGQEPTPALVAVVAARLLRSHVDRNDSAGSSEVLSLSKRQPSPASSSSTGCGSTHNSNATNRLKIFRAINQRHSAESKAPRSVSPGRGGKAKGRVTCQVAGCMQDLTAGRETYTGRYRVCARHMVEPAVVLYADQPHELYRFCNQCFKFEKLAAFDGTKRGCRAALAKRRERSRAKRLATVTGQQLQLQGLFPGANPQAHPLASPALSPRASAGTSAGSFPVAAALSEELSLELHGDQVAAATAATAATGAQGSLLAELLSAINDGNSELAAQQVHMVRAGQARSTGNTPAASGGSPACPSSSQQQQQQQVPSPGGSISGTGLAASPSPLPSTLSSPQLQQLQQALQQQRSGDAQCCTAQQQVAWESSAPLGLLLAASSQRCTSAPDLLSLQAAGNPEMQQLLDAPGGADPNSRQSLKLQAAAEASQAQQVACRVAATAAEQGLLGADADADDDDHADFMDMRELSFTLMSRPPLHDLGLPRQLLQPPAAVSAAAPGAAAALVPGDAEAASPFLQQQSSGLGASDEMDVAPCGRIPSCSYSSSSAQKQAAVVAAVATTAAAAAAAAAASSSKRPGLRQLTASGNLSSMNSVRSVVYDAMLDELAAWFTNPTAEEPAQGNSPDAVLPDDAAVAAAMAAAAAGNPGIMAALADQQDAADWDQQQMPPQQQQQWQVWQQQQLQSLQQLQQQQLGTVPSAPAALGKAGPCSSLQAASGAAAAPPPPQPSLPLQPPATYVPDFGLAGALLGTASAPLPADSGGAAAPQQHCTSADLVDTWNAVFAGASSQIGPSVQPQPPVQPHSTSAGKPPAVATFELERQLSAAQKMMADMQRKLQMLKSQQQS